MNIQTSGVKIDDFRTYTLQILGSYPAALDRVLNNVSGLGKYPAVLGMIKMESFNINKKRCHDNEHYPPNGCRVLTFGRGILSGWCGILSDSSGIL